MRVNIYSQELTSDVELLEKEGADGALYSAVAFLLASSERLHVDDQSAVTFWLPKSATRRDDLAATFERAARLVRSAPEETKS